jgi:hypothetical protein
MSDPDSGPSLRNVSVCSSPLGLTQHQLLTQVGDFQLAKAAPVHEKGIEHRKGNRGHRHDVEDEERADQPGRKVVVDGHAGLEHWRATGRAKMRIC